VRTTRRDPVAEHGPQWVRAAPGVTVTPVVYGRDVGLPRFAVVDVETSGLSTSRHRILQIGLVTVEPDGEVVDQWSTLVRLRWPWSRVGPRRVHGITRQSLRGAPRAVEALGELRERLDGSVFTAHNADFDAAFIERAAARADVPISLERRLCTLQLSRRLDPDRQLTHGLADVCARYDVVLEHHHDALSDAKATAGVLPHLLAAYHVSEAADLDPLYSRLRVPAASA
jgi:DNA polymerase III subunit epsilon